ncbi:protein FATTY ACID EXPORT 1, chloroplastic [Phalaenopsis equestris]|uniref:protein FATTY ACID EXPORT 1, chloroplastic n=1 Tax=Phalaenopsis equestris TaxID=78828 RepID=UPI0009E3A614|nr:protein FATTY ACID EXPORT 1, chloroplastic [Phalaenopsis equestris]
MPKTIKAKTSISMRLNGNSTRIPGYEENTVLKFKGSSEKFGDDDMKPYSTLKSSDEKIGADLDVLQDSVVEQKGYAKIHDFCLGIPYGGLLFGGGLFGFLFSRNPVSLTTSMLGAGIIVLAAISLKVWRKGLSSLPFMLGQAAIAATLLVKNFQSYSLTKNLFPSGLYISMSAAMLCFYFYVVISGGNPPPKRKLADAQSR